MGNCCSSEKEMREINRQSSLANLNDSRHVMMKKASAKGKTLQKDGSFYRPRQESMILAGLPQTGDADSDIDENVGISDLPVFRNRDNMFLEDIKAKMAEEKASKDQTADTTASKEKETN
mmetsp:Transcript_22057/g.32218  ORF Transcript_22057/g.32218 Transcript_22057/m.32218 type:complete len:120 (+) Transcript_22057:34-393(+)